MKRAYVILAGLTLFLVALFAVFPRIDLAVSGWFYLKETDAYLQSAPVAGFVLKDSAFAQSVYVLVRALTALALAVAALMLLLRALKITFSYALTPRQALYIFLCFALGPGALVHWGVKEIWERPRPRHVVEFGGTEAFQPIYRTGENNGKSFVSGHTAAAFCFAAFALFHSGRKRALLYGAAVTFGLAAGAGRIMQGGHFLSDTLFAGLLALFVAHLLYDLMFRRGKLR